MLAQAPGATLLFRQPTGRALPGQVPDPKLSKSKGDLDPDEFVRLYALSIEANGGGKATMAKCFPLALEGVPLRWF